MLACSLGCRTGIERDVTVAAAVDDDDDDVDDDDDDDDNGI